MEVCDVVDELGRPIGKTVTRGTELGEGEYYLVVQVWIRNEMGEYLVQQRAPHLISGPGMWATTAGYVQTGETSLAAAMREVNEEMGLVLSPKALQSFKRLTTGRLVQEVWLADVSWQAVGTPVLGVEVTDWKWAAKNELQAMISRGQFFAYSYFAQLPE